MNILVKSATIVDETNPKLHRKKRDILIKDGIIQKIAARITNPGRIEQVDLPNLHVSRGWFDSSVCFGEPGFEERETIDHGLGVAAYSGFTDLVLNPNTYPLPDSSGDIVFLKEKNKGNAAHLHPLGTLTVKSKGEELAELYDMKNAGAVGFYDHKKPLHDANLLKIALQYSQAFEGLVLSFPMEPQIAVRGVVNEGNTSTKLGLKGIPALAEELRISRDLSVLTYAGGKLHIPTISTAKSVQLIAEAKKKGLDVSCSVAIHNLWFTDDILESFDSNTKVLPPIREEHDIMALRKALKDGVVDMVTSDHTPIDIEEKRIEYDLAEYGTIGLETSFGILNQLFDTDTAIEILTRGRERFGINSNTISEGQAASLALFNPDGKHEYSELLILSTSKNSIFMGQMLEGHVYGTYSNARLILKQS